MHSIAALKCNQDIFQAIYQNLSLYGSAEHEGLKIALDESGAFGYPVTHKKNWLDFDETDHRVSEFVLMFFEANLNRLAEQSDPHALLSKFEPFYKQPYELTRFHQIRQELYGLHAIKSTEAQRKAMLQEAESHRAQMLQKAEDDVQKLKKELAFLKENIADLEDTIVDCSDTTLSLHMKKLYKVAFFTCHYQHPEMKKSTLNDTEKKQYKYKFDFSEFHSKTITDLLGWIDNPKCIHRITDFNALFELYRLADQVNDPLFRQDCQNQISINLNEENTLQILSLAEYSSGDDLIKVCCQFVINHFTDLKDHPKFLEIKPEYFVSIIQDRSLYEEYEEEVFQAILKWAEASAKRNSINIQDVMYANIEGHRIIDPVPFGNFSKEYFISQILPLNLLSAEDTIRWMEFHIKNEATPPKHVHDFRIKSLNDNKAKISWNIPLETFCSIGNWRGGQHREEFSYLEFPWQLRLGKKNGFMFIALYVENKTRDFDFFLDLAHIQMHTKSINAEHMINFTPTKGIYDTYFIKGVCIELEEFEHIAPVQGGIPLKILIFMKNSPPSAT